MHNIRRPEQFSCVSFKRSPLIKDVIHDITHCPVCGAKGIARMRNHIRRVHKNISPEERRKLLRESRRSTQRVDEEYTENQLQVHDSSLNSSEGWNCDGGNEGYKDFIMAIQYPPVLPRERNEVRKYKSEFLKAWKKKSLEPLSRNAKRITWKMYNKFQNSNSRWTLKKSFINVVD